MILPPSTCTPGWPEFISVVELENPGDDVVRRVTTDYVLLRDGSDVPGALGNSCIYGLLDSRGYIDRSRQWLPVLSTSRLEKDIEFTPTTWDSNEVLVAGGAPPMTIPMEPVEVPDDRAYVIVRALRNDSGADSPAVPRIDLP